jgi:hypothetical protein
LICLILWRLGTFERFWFWTFTYAQFYAGISDAEMAWNQLQMFMRVCGWVKWSLPWAAAGLICLFKGKGNADRRFILTTLLVFSLPAYCAGFYFREHYFIVMLPVVSLLTAVAVCAPAGARTAWARLGPAAVFVAACAGFVCNQGGVWFQMTPDAVCRTEYGQNPFVDSVEIGRFVRAHSAADARIAVLGSEPEIYFYAHRRSASGFIYMYDLVRVNRYTAQFQREMMDEIMAAQPRFLVVVKLPGSWLIQPGADEALARWAPEYMGRYYDAIGKAYVYPDHSDFVWGPESAKERSDTKFTIAVYQRKEQI